LADYDNVDKWTLTIILATPVVCDVKQMWCAWKTIFNLLLCH